MASFPPPPPGVPPAPPSTTPPPPAGSSFVPAPGMPQLPRSSGKGWIAVVVVLVVLLVGARFVVYSVFHAMLPSKDSIRAGAMTPPGGLMGMGGLTGGGSGASAGGTWVGLVTVDDGVSDEHKRTAAVEVTMTASSLSAFIPMYGMKAKMTEEGHGEEIALSSSKIVTTPGPEGMNGVLESSSEAAWNECFVTGGMGKAGLHFGLQGMSGSNASLKGTLHHGTDAEYASLAQKVTSGQEKGGVEDVVEEPDTPAGPVSHPITKTAAGLAQNFMQLTDSREFEDGFLADGTMKPGQQKTATKYMDGLSDKVEADEKDQNVYVLGDLYLSMATTVYGMLRFEHYQGEHATVKMPEMHEATESADAQAAACETLMKEAVSAQAFEWKRPGGAYCLDVPAGVTREQAVEKMTAFLKVHK